MSNRLEKLGLGPPIPIKPIDEIMLKELRKLEDGYQDALLKGELYRKTSKVKWGGNDYPMQQK